VGRVNERDHQAILNRALSFVAEFHGDPRCALNSVHAEALAAEVIRLRLAFAAHAVRCPQCHDAALAAITSTDHASR